MMYQIDCSCHYEALQQDCKLQHFDGKTCTCEMCMCRCHWSPLEMLARNIKSEYAIVRMMAQALNK